MKRIFFWVLVLVLIFGLSCDRKESSLPSISDFPEEIVSDGELAFWDSTTLAFSREFTKWVWLATAGRIRRYGVVCSYCRGKETKEPIIVFHIAPGIGKGPSFAVWAYYVNELIERVEKKYPDGYSVEQVIGVLYPEVEILAKGLAEAYKKNQH